MRRYVANSRKHPVLAAAGAVAIGVVAVIAVAQTGAPRFEPQIERRIALHDTLIETVRVETQLQGWTLRKVCLDGQAYWLGFGEPVPTGIAVAYKDGKPEQCNRGRN